MVNVLRTQLNELDRLKREREAWESEIKGVNFDMRAKFLLALAQSGAINEEQLSSSQLEEMYAKYNVYIRENLDSQERVLGDVQVRRVKKKKNSLKHELVSEVGAQPSFTDRREMQITVAALTI